ncbi:nitroreductase family protein [Streptomyces sp. NPDC048416]|uniref:nitroreductase family protein n=1 Tax=Streptomyces sp. NPDC048416 TaxID=3365546 RepID=UPI00371AB29C
MPIVPEGEFFARVLDSLTSPLQAATATATTPVPPRLGRPVEQVLSTRRSVRSFTAQPVSRDCVEAIGQAALDIGGDTSLIISARRIEEVSVGSYLFSRGTGLTPASGLHLGPVERVYADAAVLLMICGDLATACDRDGVAGYSRLLVQAGAAGHAAWLTAVSLGLHGSVHGRSFSETDEAVRRSFGWSHLFTLAIGHGC